MQSECIHLFGRSERCLQYAAVLPKECRASFRSKLPNQGRRASGRVLIVFRNSNKTGISAAPASIRGAIDLQAVATGLSVEVLLGEAVERFLDREAAVG